MEPVTTPFYGAILLLKRTLADDTLEHIAATTAQTHFPGQDYNHYLSLDLPENVPVDVFDQYSAAMRDLPEGAVYFVVSPE